MPCSACHLRTLCAASRVSVCVVGGREVAAAADRLRAHNERLQAVITEVEEQVREQSGVGGQPRTL